MTLTEMQNNIRELGGQIRAAAATLAAAAADPKTPTATLTQQRDALNDMNARMAALQSAYNAQHDGEASGLSMNGQSGTHDQDSSLRPMLKSTNTPAPLQTQSAAARVRAVPCKVKSTRCFMTP